MFFWGFLKQISKITLNFCIFIGKKIMNFYIFLTLYKIKVTSIKFLKGILTIFLLDNFVCS